MAVSKQDKAKQDKAKQAQAKKDEKTSKDKEFYNIFDGTHGRVNSRYLDMDERLEAEKNRAFAEDREPDYSDPGKLSPGVGTPVVVVSQLPDNRYYSNPATATVEAATGEEKDVDPVLTAEVDTDTAEVDVDLGYAAQVARERRAQDEALEGAADVSTSTPSNTAGPEFTESTVESPDSNDTSNGDSDGSNGDADLSEFDINTNDTTTA